jgi:hypothetical protein
MIKTFTRAELQEIENKALQCREATLNPVWQMAYDNLIFACNVLNAFEARASVPDCACQSRPLEIIPGCGWDAEALQSDAK